MRAAPRGPSLLFGRAGAAKTGGGASAFFAKKKKKKRVREGERRLICKLRGQWHAGGYPLRPAPARAHTF